MGEEVALQGFEGGNFGVMDHELLNVRDEGGRVGAGGGGEGVNVGAEGRVVPFIFYCLGEDSEGVGELVRKWLAW